MKGMTASNPANGQPTTAQCSMSFECFDRICRTTGKVATGCGKQWRQGHLVEPNQSNKNGAHNSGKKAASFVGTLHQFISELGE